MLTNMRVRDLPPWIPVKKLHLYGGPKTTKTYALLREGKLKARRTPHGTMVEAKSFVEYMNDQPRYIHVPPELEELRDVL